MRRQFPILLVLFVAFNLAVAQSVSGSTNAERLFAAGKFTDAQVVYRSRSPQIPTIPMTG